MRQFARLATLAAILIPSAVIGLVSPAQAVPTINIATKCGYFEATVNSDVTATANISLTGSHGSRNDIPIIAGINVFTIVASPGDTVYVDVALGEDGIQANKFYVRPDGCHQPLLRFKYQMACGAKALITVENTGDAPAEHFFIYRVDIRTPVHVQEAIVSDVTLPVGTSYFVADKLTDFKDVINLDRGTDVAQQAILSGLRYDEPAGCADTPKVAFAATCTGVDITTDPADAPLTTVVKGQPDTQDRTGTARTVAMTTGEALLVKSGETVVDAFVYARSSGCDVPPPSSPPGGSLPTTGDRVLLIVGVGVGLLLIGALVFVTGRGRRAKVIR